MQNGKGDKPRVTNWTKYGENFDQIKWSNTKKRVLNNSDKKKPS